MTTYVILRTRIDDELIDEAVSSVQINSAIKTAIKNYERESWWFNEKVGTFATVASQELYTSSDLSDIPNMTRIHSMRLDDDTNGPGIKPVDNDVIEDAQDGSLTGTPSLYSRFANKIRLYPIPSGVWTVTVSYAYKLTELSADSDTNAWTDECEELIRQAAKRILATDIMQADDIAARYGAAEQAAYSRLRRENTTRKPSTLRTGWPFGGRTFNVETGV